MRTRLACVSRLWLMPQHGGQPILLLMRLLLGGILIVSSLAKLTSGTDFVGVVSSYGMLPQALAELYGSVLPWLELLVGVSLVLGLFTRLAAAAAFCLVLSFTVANVHALLSDTYHSGADLCGCLGTAVPLDHKGALAMDVAMLAMSIPLVLFKTRLLSLGSRFSLGTGIMSRRGLAHSLPANITMAMVAMLMLVPSSLLVGNRTAVDSSPEASVQSLIDNALDDGRPVFLFVYLDTCSYCRKEKPIVDRLESEYGDRVAFVRANGAEEPEIVNTFGFDGYPAMALISGADKNGDYIYRSFVGFTSEETLRAALEALISGSYSAVDMAIDKGLAEGKPVFLFIYAEWCTYCKKQKPIIESLEAEYGDLLVFVRADAAENPEALKEFDVTGFPAMFLITERGEAGYAYRGFGGFTERETLAGVIDYVLHYGRLPEGDVGYEHHSCSVSTCYENCIADKFEFPSMMEMERFLTDAALDCLGASAGDAFKNAYENAKTGECASACATADDPREYGDCAQCAIGETIGKIPAAGCVVTLWSALGDVLEPHADCLAECSAPSSTWEKNWGHQCRDFQGEQTRCAGPNLMETLGCRDCGWVVTNVYACDDGCEMTAAGAACKGKCKEEWCDDGDDCTIDWCLRGECKHERKSECCPQSCDDGDRCTEDYCDGSGACQHTDNPACRCQNNNCDDGDRCTIDSCDPLTGRCVHARGPGCDAPDENEDFSSMYYDGAGESDPGAQIAILATGYNLLLLDRLESLGILAALVQSIDEAFSYPVLAIPTGGLSGLDTSDVFKTKLERYVSEGGTLIAFDQQYGYDFTALPGGQVSGYGWDQDESCHTYSVGVAQYHPILAWAGGGTLSLNVDGFFMTYPSDAAVLLDRMKNGQPVMLLYEYGQGRVLATTVFSDMSLGLNLGTPDEKEILRSLFVWAVTTDEIETLTLDATKLAIPVHNPYTGTADLPAFQIGDEVAFSIDVTNAGSASAKLVKFLVSDPHFNQSWVEVKKTIGAGKTEAVDFTFPTDGSSEKGVWTVLYFLYDGEEFLGAELGGRFTVGYSPSDYSSFRAIVTIKDTEGNLVLEEERDLPIAPGETGAIEIDLPDTTVKGTWSARYSVLSNDGKVLLSSLKRFARSAYLENPQGFVWYKYNDTFFDAVSDHFVVVMGADETFYVHVYNRSDSNKDLEYRFTWNGETLEGFKWVHVPAQSTVTIPYTMTIDDLGWGWFSATFWEGGRQPGQLAGTGGARRLIVSYRPYVDVKLALDKPSYTVADSLVATVQLTNMGPGTYDAHTVVQLQDTTGNVLAEQSFDESLLSYTVGREATLTRNLTFALPGGMAPGTYVVNVMTYTNQQNTGRAYYYFPFVKPYTLAINMDRATKSYRAGGSIQISADVENISTVPWESDVELAVPALGSPITAHVSLAPGATQTITYPVALVPADIAAGSYTVTATVEKDGYAETDAFTIRAAWLQLAIVETGWNAGGELGLSIVNTGGARTGWTCTLEAAFAADPAVDTGTLMPLQSDNMQLAIPITTVGGQYHVKAQCQASGKTFYLAGYVQVEGAELTLELADTDYSAGDTVSITLANTGPVDTTGVCSIDLTDEFRDTVYTESGTVKNVSAGGSVPLPFTIPAWATGGWYRLEAECVDSLNSKVASLVTYLNVTGVDATLTSVTDRETYTSDNIDVQTHIVNSALPLSGTLHLWMWEAVKSESVLTRLWANHEGGAGTDTPAAITADAAGNVYVTGKRQNGTYTDYATVKYSPDGVRLWEATYAGESDRDDAASAIAVDASGNVYVTGTSREQKPGELSFSPKETCTTVKYNAAGVQQWVKKFHGSANSYDRCYAIAVAGGFVYVAGQSASTGTYGDYVTIKYNASTGGQEWVSTYNGAGNYLDSATGLVVDGTGNVYVSGYSLEASMTPYLTTIKYNSGGVQQWASYSEYPAGSWNTPAYISLSPVDAGVLVAGSVTPGSSADFGLMKYDTADGSQEWARYYDGPVNLADTVVGLAVDSAGNAVVTGSVTVAESGGELFDRDIAVRKYDAAGTLKWAASYSSSPWKNDDPAGVAVDADGNVYVTGNSPSWEGWATLKYDGESGDQEWITIYSGLDDRAEDAKGIAVSAAGAIHVTGMSAGDYATVKYIERATGDAVWETDIPLSLAASETRDISTPVNIPTELVGITGKLYLGAQLLNAGGKTVAWTQPWPFYIVPGGLSLTLNTLPVRDFYRPGETVTISGTVRNDGAASEDCTLTITKDGVAIFTEAFTLGAGESRAYSTTTSSDTTFVLQATVNDVSVADTVTVKPYNLAVSIIAPDVVGFAPFEAGVLLENSSDMSYTLHVVLSADVWDIDLEPGESKLLQTSLSITADTALTATVSGDVPMTVQKSVAMGEKATVETAADQTYMAGPIEVPFTVANTGLLDVAFSITFTMDGQVVVREVSVPAGVTLSDTISLNLADGTHMLSYTSAYGSGSAQIHAAGEPKFVVTEMPSNIDLVAGDPTWVFKVKNTGGSEGAALFTLTVPDFQDTKLEWLKAGEEKEISFTFVIPDDLEGKDYKASYTINGETTEFVFHLDGPKVSVAASLDKELYQAGETAILTLKVDNTSEFDLDLFARVQLGEHLETVDFELNGLGAFRTLTFNVPVDFDSGKLFYGIYMSSGRALYLNAIYVHERKSLVLYMNKQTYDMGEEAVITVEPQGPGTLMMTAPGGYLVNTDLSGPASFKFTVPALVTGTYYVEYTFAGDSGKYAFDVRGYSVLITRLKVDKSKYAPGDTINITLDAELNLAVDNGTVRYRIYDRKGSLVNDFQVATTLAAGDNHIVTTRTLSADVSGTLLLSATLVGDVPGQPGMMLASAVRYFDGGGTNLAPEPEAGLPYFGTEGAMVLFDAGLSSDPEADPLQYRWDFDNDGRWDTDWSSDPTGAWTYGDQWDGKAKVEVKDATGSAVLLTNVVLSNMAPWVDAGPAREAVAGRKLAFYGSFVDPGKLDTHAILWDFGDGSTDSEGLSPTHVYKEPGTYTVTLTVTDDDGGVGTDTLSITVGVRPDSGLPFWVWILVGLAGVVAAGIAAFLLWRWRSARRVANPVSPSSRQT